LYNTTIADNILSEKSTLAIFRASAAIFHSRGTKVELIETSFDKLNLQKMLEFYDSNFLQMREDFWNGKYS
jgi:hypothetical protein